MKPGVWHREASCRADADAPPPGRAASAPQLRAARVSKASLLVSTRTASGRRIAGAVVRGRCSDAAVPGHKGCAPSIKTLRTDFSSLPYAKARVISILQTEITVKI